MPCNAKPRGTWLPSHTPVCALDFDHNGPHKSKPMPIIDYSGNEGARHFTRIAIWESGGQVTWVRADDFRSANGEDV